MKNVLILEDNEATLELVGNLINEIDSNAKVYKTSTLPDAYQMAVEHKINLFIIDIIIDNSIRNDVSGLRFVEKIRDINKYAFVPVIFITSLVDPEIHAYKKLHCYAYLEKPLLIKEAKKLIGEALQFPEQKQEEGILFFRKDGVIYAVNKEEIVYITSHAGKVTITTVKDELTLYYRNCKYLLNELDSDQFIQCGRGAIVNKTFIDNVDPVNRVIKLTGDFGTLEIGIVLKKKFMEKIKDDRTNIPIV